MSISARARVVRTASPSEPRTPATAAERLGLAVLLLATAVLYLSNLVVNGMANGFYAASAWAGTQSWEALLFGSVDPSNFITVDKPPLSQWVMGLSGRLFGFSSMSLLGPEAVMGVVTVWFTYAMTARVVGRKAGLVAGLVMALTPVAALMFRFDNPDAAMVMLMTMAAYCTVRAAQVGSGRWLMLAGAALGLAFLAKMLEGLMSLPALALLYVLCAPTTVRRKVGHLAAAAGAMVVAAGWYVAMTMLWPASTRPYLAGSTDNSFLQVAFGYNGLQRIQGRTGAFGGADVARTGMADVATAFGDRAGGAGVAGAGGFAGMRGGAAVGPFRLFQGEFGAEISWLLPAALVALVAVLVLRWKAPATDLVRGVALMAGAWVIIDGAVLSMMGGTTHPYYSLAIAPAIAVLVGVGAHEAWAARDRMLGRLFAVAMVAAAGIWGFVLVRREAPGWQPWLAWVLAGATVVAVVALLAGSLAKRLAPLAVAASLIAGLAAPAAYAVTDDTLAHAGSSPSVSPVATRQDGGRGFGGMGALGGMGGVGTLPAALTSRLQGSHTTWAAAVPTSSAASSIELAARVPIMAIGGFTGGDPTPSLSQFQSDVAAGRIGYYIGSATGGGGASGEDTGGAARAFGFGMGGRGRTGVTAQIAAWVAANYTPQTVGSVTVYNLQRPLHK